GSFVKFDSANSAKEYLLIGTHLSVRSNDFESNDAGGDGTYGTVAQTTFEAIDASVRFVPERKTAIPTVQGVQTAIVIGAPGDKGDPPSTDEYGRVRVRFHWDGFGREDASADYKSCWVRVSQMWAGKTWGAMTLPHKGQEVIVDFEEGDPDRPIITGRVYNQATMPYLVPQDNVNRFVLRDLGENRMTMDSTDGRQSIELYSPTATSALTIGHKDVSSTGHADGVDIDPSRPGGTVDDDIQGVKIKTAQHFACVTNKDVIFDVQERWNQRIHGTNQDPTGNRDAPNAWETVINNGDATIKLENGSLNLKVLGGSNGKFDMDVDHNFDLYVKNNYTELTDGDFSSTVGGHGDRLNHSNATSATLGSTNDLFIGEKGSLHIGLDFSAFIGGKVSFVLALEAALNIAGKAEANIGGSIAIDVAKRIEYTIFPKIEKNGTDLKNDLISLKNTTGAALKQAAISMAKSSSLSSYMAPFHMFI
ncbi:MAG: type VI secretion system tip protein VgrG, partial [Phycisphaerales bacterium]|nr:type VI secretion system tip protein VgrG [Phycisphaerales bacterium]